MLNPLGQTSETTSPGTKQNEVPSSDTQNASQLPTFVPAQAPNALNQAPIGPSLVLPHEMRRSNPQYQSKMQNAGMTAGVVVGSLDGGTSSTIDDMALGGVVGGIVGQRLAQAENHAFWREQAMAYREGRANGSIPPEDRSGTKPSWWSKEGRADRRAERWERRARRREGQ